MPMRKNQLKTNRKKKIRKQFVDMLESLSVSIAAGQNVPSAMQTVKDDLLIQYTEKDYIVQEISVFLLSFSDLSYVKIPSVTSPEAYLFNK